MLGNLPAIPSELDDFRDGLSESSLKDYLPPKWFPGVVDDAKRATAYASFLQNQAQVLESYSVIIALGLEIIGQAWPALTAAEQAIAAPQIMVLDQMAVKPDSPANLRPQVLAATAAALPAGLGGAAPAHTTQSLAGQIRGTALATWIFGLVAVAALGAVTQVLMSPGFGAWVDYPKAALWDSGYLRRAADAAEPDTGGHPLGIQFAGTQIMSTRRITRTVMLLAAGLAAGALSATAATTVMLSSSNSNSVYGSAVTLTATVTPAGATGQGDVLRWHHDSNT